MRASLKDLGSQTIPPGRYLQIIILQAFCDPDKLSQKLTEQMIMVDREL